MCVAGQIWLWKTSVFLQRDPPRNLLAQYELWQISWGMCYLPGPTAAECCAPGQYLSPLACRLQFFLLRELSKWAHVLCVENVHVGWNQGSQKEQNGNAKELAVLGFFCPVCPPSFFFLFFPPLDHDWEGFGPNRILGFYFCLPCPGPWKAGFSEGVLSRDAEK